MLQLVTLRSNSRMGNVVATAGYLPSGEKERATRRSKPFEPLPPCSSSNVLLTIVEEIYLTLELVITLDRVGVQDLGTGVFLVIRPSSSRGRPMTDFTHSFSRLDALERFSSIFSTPPTCSISRAILLIHGKAPFSSVMVHASLERCSKRDRARRACEITAEENARKISKFHDTSVCGFETV